MDVSIGPYWEDFVGEMVRSGRYASADEVISAGLRLVEERDARVHALRNTPATRDFGQHDGR